MKKFLLFLTLIISAIGLSHAAVQSATLTFTDTDGDKKVYEYDVLSGTTSEYQNVEITDGDITIKYTTDNKLRFWSDGLRFYSGGGITISVPTGKYITKISITSTSNSSFKINEESTTLSKDWTNSNTTINSVTLKYTPTSKNQALKTLIVTYDDASGEVSKDCGISFSSDSENVDYPGTDYKLPFNNEHNVTVTFSSSDAKVASVDENTGAVTINGCGTTTITASFAGDANYNGKAVSFDLTVNKIATSISFPQASYPINLGDTFTAPTPTLNGIPEGATLSWESSKPDVATVDAGNVTLGETTGTTTITATYTGDETHASASASFTLNVVDPSAIIDTFGYSNLTFTTSSSTGYSSFTYTITTSGAEYAGYAYKGNSNNDIQTKKTTENYNGLYVSKVPANLKISKIVIKTSSKNSTSAKITVYGSTTAFGSTGTGSADELGSLTSEGTLTIDFHDGNNEALYGKVYNAFCVNAVASNTSYISSVEVVWEPLQEGDIKAEPGLAYAETEVEKTMGDETIIFTNPLINPNSLPITYSIAPADSPVATVDANGQVTVKAAGTVKIVASFAGDETYKAGSASYTLTVIDTKLTDTFNASNLIFDEGSGYRNFTYTGTSRAVYGGFADANESTLMIQNQANGKSGIFVSQAPEGYKLHTITVTTATGSADLTLYGSTKPYASVSTDGKYIGTFEGGNKDYIYVNGYEGDIAAYGIIPTTFSICGADKASSVTEITVIWEVDTRAEAKLAYSTTEVTLAEGETLTQPTLNNPNEVPVTYTTDNDAVATVAEDGKITLVEGGIGTAVITAYTDGNASYKPASTTFTITVKKAQIAYLVTDASTLKVGDIIIIANQEEAMAISTEEKTDNRPATAITFNSDKSEIVSIGSNVMLFELKEWKDSDGTFWMLYTTNYTDTNGALYSSSSSSTLKIGTPKNNYFDAVITIDQETGEANIAFNKGASSGTNIMRYNSTSDLFNCYTATSSQKPVYIYRVTDKPATVTSEVSGSSFLPKVNKDDNNVVELETMFLTSTSYKKVAIYMENILVGTFAVNSTTGEVDATFDHVPYLPSAKFTMRPVLNTDSEGNPTQFGPAESLNFDWADINSYSAHVLSKNPELVWIGSDADPLPATATLGANTYFGINVTAPNLNYYVDVVATKAGTDEVYTGEFSWYEGGFCYSVNPYITDVPVDTKDKSLNFSEYTGEFPTIEYSIQPIYKFDVAEQYRSLLTPATPHPARVAGTITDGVQTVVCDAKSLQSTFSATTAVSGVEGVTVDGGAAVEYFNLQGVRVDGDLAPGIYIRRQGQSVSKVQIR